MPIKYAQIILDVPTVGGRLMLVDMAGSENIEAAGQTGFEAKMQVTCPKYTCSLIFQNESLFRSYIGIE